MKLFGEALRMLGGLQNASITPKRIVLIREFSCSSIFCIWLARIMTQTRPITFPTCYIPQMYYNLSDDPYQMLSGVRFISHPTQR